MYHSCELNLQSNATNPSTVSRIKWQKSSECNLAITYLVSHFVHCASANAFEWADTTRMRKRTLCRKLMLKRGVGAKYVMGA